MEKATLKVGIASYEEMKARTMAIARGQLKPDPEEPRVWFPSLESLSKILSVRNQELLGIIARQRPQSLAELESLTGRAKSNLSRTLKTMERYGLVELESGADRKIRPHVRFSHIQLDMPLATQRS